MAQLADIQTEADARTYALGRLRGFLREVVPNRRLLLEDRNNTLPTTDYLVVDILQDDDLAGAFSEQPLYFDTNEQGRELYIFTQRMTIELICYIGDAYGDLRKIKTMLRTKVLQYNHFGSTEGRVGINDVRTVRDTPIVVDNQEVQPCARLQIKLGYIHKFESEGLGTINQVQYRTTTKTGMQDVVDDSTDNLPTPPP